MTAIAHSQTLGCRPRHKLRPLHPPWPLPADGVPPHRRPSSGSLPRQPNLTCRHRHFSTTEEEEGAVGLEALSCRQVRLFDCISERMCGARERHDRQHADTLPVSAVWPGAIANVPVRRDEGGCQCRCIDAACPDGLNRAETLDRLQSDLFQHHASKAVPGAAEAVARRQEGECGILLTRSS